MRFVRVDVGQDLGEEALYKFRLNVPPGGWFPALQALNWSCTRFNLPYLDLFLSQNLTAIAISTSWGDPESPRSSLQVIASTISALPTSTPRLLSVHLHDHGIPRTYLKDSLSSVVLRCGPSFRDFSTLIPLSDAAVSHLILLPHLHTGTTPLSWMRGPLDTLNTENFPEPTIDPSFTSVIQTFRNMVYLNVAVVCRNGQCVFNLNNDDVAELAMALPRLEFLLLGYPCDKNTCATTVACLLPLSVRCARLQSLWIHFNTMNIVDDIKTISEDPRFQGLRSLQKCALSRLNVHKLPLTLDGSELETLARGMTDIFPNLECCDGWDEFNSKLAEVQG